MVLVGTALTEDELVRQIKKYYNAEVAQNMLKNADTHGMAFYGIFAVQKIRFDKYVTRYNLLRKPGKENRNA